MTLPVFEMRDVSFGYDSRPVLEGVNLEVAEGGFVSIIGPNGGGKSTLLKLLLGLLEPQRGQVRVFGESVEGRPIRAARVPRLAPDVGAAPGESTAAASGDDERVPRVLVCGNIHGLERISSETIRGTL